MESSFDPRKVHESSKPVRFGVNTRTITSLLLALMVLVARNHPSFAGGQSSTLAQSQAERGLQLAQAGDLQAAEKQLRQAVKIAPADAFCWASLGSILGMQQKLEESSLCFERALKIDPMDTGSRRNLASNQFQLGRLKPAKENLERVLKEHSKDPKALLLLGMVGEELREYPQALRCFELVPDQVRQYPKAIIALARSYYKTGQNVRGGASLLDLRAPVAQPEEILRGGQVAADAGDLETAQRLFDSIAATYSDPGKLAYHRALAFYRANRFAECQSLLDQLLADKPVSGDLYNLQAWCFYKQGNLKKAVESMDQAIDREPRRESHYLDLARMLAEQHRYSVALVAAQKATEVSPNSAQAFLTKGLSEFELKQFANSVLSYQRAVALDPDSPEALLGLALAQVNSGSSKEANSTFADGIRRFPGEAKLYQEYGRFLLDPVEGGGQIAEQKGVSLLNRALQLNPSLPDCHVQLGNLALAKGKAEDAILHLREAAGLDPRNSRIQYSLSRAYRHLGKTEESLEALRLYEKLKTEEKSTLDKPFTSADKPTSSTH